MSYSDNKMVFKASAQRDSDHGSSVYCKEARLTIDTGRIDAFNPERS